jgi:hypothetical protein
MTTPTIFANGYTSSADAFLNAPSGQGIPSSPVRATATIPASTASGTVIGLIPFNKNASVEMGSGVLLTADLDTGTSVTFTLGYVYDDNVTYTNDADAFILSSTAFQSTAALVSFNGTGGFSFVAEANGWIAITTGGGTTTTAGDVTLEARITYDRY